MRIWLPPEFDPASGTPAGNMLQARIAEFNLRRPKVRIEVRIKAASGPGGLLDSLTTTSAAAPRALPDLIALPRQELETAAIKGLLTPYDHLTAVMDGSDWFQYAQQLARVQDSVYGLPFAGDILVMAYHVEVLPAPPVDWKSVLTLKSPVPLFFPAADPQALFTIALYQSNDGPLRDNQGRPFLDVTKLSEVFSFYRDSEQAGMMLDSVTQIQNEDQVWDEFQKGRTDFAVIWASRYLASPGANTAIAPLPTRSGQPYTLANGWVWALDAHQTGRQALSIELAEFLTEPGFLANWTEAAGYLPARVSSLNAWSNTSVRAAIDPLAVSARLQPAADIISSLGNPLQQATVRVLGQQQDPAKAAQKAADGLTGP